MKIVTDYFRELYDASVHGWNRFWFSPADPATLGMIRVLAGSMIFYTHLVWSVDLVGFFGPEGRIPNEFSQAYFDGRFDWSLLHWLNSSGLIWTLHLLGLVAIAMFTVGLFTRVTSVLTFAIVVSYVHRGPGALFGLDQINGLLALYLMIGPSGAAYSVDRLIQRWRSKSCSSVPDSSIMANVAIRFIQLHMCVIYLFAGFGKLLGDRWWLGDALWGALANYEYQTLDMTWLAGFPLVINFLTLITLVWECSFIALVWPRLTRPIVVALAIPLHLGIAFCMGMITFGLVMLIADMAFVSPWLIRAIVDRPVNQLMPKLSLESGGR